MIDLNLFVDYYSIDLASHYNLRSNNSPTAQPLVQQIDNLQHPINSKMSDAIIRAFDSIKPFYGTSQDNSRDWCDRAEIIFGAFNINDLDRLSRIGIKLEDAAFDWYRDNPGPYVTWVAFRQVFERAFPPPERTQNPHLLAEQINQRKQGADESVHDYFYALDKLCRQYDPQMSAIDKTIKLVGGLREELKEKILPLNVQTPEQFLSQAKNYESTEKVMAHHRKQVEPVQLPEPVYVHESSDYPMVAVSQPREQFNSMYYQGFEHPQQLIQQRPQQLIQPQPQQLIQQRPQQSAQQRFYRPSNNYQTTTTYAQPQIQRNVQRFQNNYYSKFNDGEREKLKQCYKCGRVGHIQKHCQHHLN